MYGRFFFFGFGNEFDNLSQYDYIKIFFFLLFLQFFFFIFIILLHFSLVSNIMFKGKKFSRKNKRNNQDEASSSQHDDVQQEMDINDIKLDTIRSRNISNKELDYSKDDVKGIQMEEFNEDFGRMYSREGGSGAGAGGGGDAGSIGDVDDGPKLHRGLKARHV